MEGGGAGTAVALVTHTALWTERCDLTSAETLHAEAGCALNIDGTRSQVIRRPDLSMGGGLGALGEAETPILWPPHVKK